ALDLGPSPSPGTRRVLRRAFVEAQLKRAGLNVKVRGAAKVTLRRPAQTLSAAQLREAMREAVEAAIPPDVEIASLRLPPISDLKIPKAARFEVEAYFAEGAQLPIEVRVIEGDHVEVLRRLNAQVDLWGEAVGAKRALLRGEILEPEDLVPLRVRRSQLPPDALGLDFMGGVARQNVRPGVPLRAASFQPPKLFARGDQINLVRRMEGLEIIAKAEALRDGLRGASVAVRVLATRRVVQGRVIDADTVLMGD
ncbi:flagellar basal body P-ring formation chaperone FlgA, partial [Myxococcota bacterium]|nr:flagellar basal body P-ring formation chaperone FlgA [Myxococcota bacterium]MBU1899250.1 flagellar basal body P-ring formation chaperone FlgA [Myxococcota bacterium]